jgi:hypothetical protein
MMMGGKVVPLAYFWKAYKDKKELLQYKVQFENAAQASNNGMEFEGLLAAAICNASHNSGINGTNIQSFLDHLIYNMQSFDTTLRRIECSSEFLDLFSCIIIPFLAPPNLDWPDWIQGLGNFGSVKRARNTDGIDFMVDVYNIKDQTYLKNIITGEAKDHLKALEGSEIIKALKSIKNESRLHFIFAKQFQKNYFTKKKPLSSYLPREFCSKWGFVLVRLNQSLKTYTMEQMVGFPDYSPQFAYIGYVMFIEIPQ